MVTLEWLAGFFDGEGCVRLHKAAGKVRDTFSPFLQLSQKDTRILEAVIETFGGRLHKQDSYTSVVRWRGEQAIELARMLLPYSKCKRKQLALLLKAMETPTHLRRPFFDAITAEKKNVKVA